MRRFLRILLNAATVVSLALCAAGVAAWGYSVGHSGGIRWVRPALTAWAQYEDGVVGMGFVRDSEESILLTLRPPVYGWQTRRGRLPQPDRSPGRSVARGYNPWGFGAAATVTVAPPDGVWHVGGRTHLRGYAPCWLLTGVFAALPTVRVWGRARRARRVAAGLCPTCGYDLRATPERCPECGRPAPAGAAKPADAGPV